MSYQCYFMLCHELESWKNTVRQGIVRGNENFKDFDGYLHISSFMCILLVIDSADPGDLTEVTFGQPSHLENPDGTKPSM